jgi:aromatic ring-cleaving dioxygenase
MTTQSPRIEGYHAHVYYDAAHRPTAERLAAAVDEKFAAAKIAGLFDEPVGPHPTGNLQIVFGATEFGTLVPWLMTNRDGLDVLVHPLSQDSLRDHDTDGLWLGTPVKLRLHRMRPGYRPEQLPAGERT